MRARASVAGAAWPDAAGEVTHAVSKDGNHFADTPPFRVVDRWVNDPERPVRTPSWRGTRVGPARTSGAAGRSTSSWARSRRSEIRTGEPDRDCRNGEGEAPFDASPSPFVFFVA